MESNQSEQKSSQFMLAASQLINYSGGKWNAAGRNAASTKINSFASCICRRMKD